ncbi:MAG: M20/M25/M40 family metallo-hydrolase [Thermofilaceae archaeon]|nr:M20/M25/M40 family metallo-hydrolase [Thermofilaceae archaeon]
MNVDIVEELSRLVKIRSEVFVDERGSVIRFNYSEAAEAVANLAEKVELNVEVVDLEVDGNKVPAIIAGIPRPTAQDKPTIAFVSHYDVIPAKGPWIVAGRQIDPYEPTVVDGKVYGRGAADDKSAIVASIIALSELNFDKLKYYPQVVVTGDEEVGGLGVRALIDKGYRWDKVVILDAGADYLSIGASGVVFGWIKVRGKSGHAGYPHKTVNPVENAVKLANYIVSNYKPRRASKLSRFNAPPGSPLNKVWGRFNFTILKLSPGEPEKHNRIPSEVMLGFDMRLLPEEDLGVALEELYSHFSEATAALGVDAEISAWGQRGWYAKDECFIEEALEASRKAYESLGLQSNVYAAAELGGNDGTFFDSVGIPVVAFGAMRTDCNVHSENEFVYIQDLILLKEFVKYLAKGS